MQLQSACSLHFNEVCASSLRCPPTTSPTSLFLTWLFNSCPALFSLMSRPSALSAVSPYIPLKPYIQLVEFLGLKYRLWGSILYIKQHFKDPQKSLYGSCSFKWMEHCSQPVSVSSTLFSFSFWIYPLNQPTLCLWKTKTRQHRFMLSLVQVSAAVDKRQGTSEGQIKILQNSPISLKPLTSENALLLPILCNFPFSIAKSSFTFIFLFITAN